MALDKMNDPGTVRSVIREPFKYDKQRIAAVGTDNVFDFSSGNPTGKIEKPVLREKYCGGRLVENQINN